MARGDDNQVVYVDGDIPQLPLQLGQLLVDSSQISPGTTNLQQCTSQVPLIYQPVTGGYGITPAEVAAGVMPTDYYYPEGRVERYGGVEGGTVDSRAAWMTAYSVFKNGGVSPWGVGTYLLGKDGANIYSLRWDADAVLHGNGLLTLVGDGVNEYTLLYINGGTDVTIDITGVVFDCAKTSIVSASSNDRCIRTTSSIDTINIAQCHFRRYIGDGILLGSTVTGPGGFIRDCTADDGGYSAVNAFKGERIVVSKFLARDIQLQPFTFQAVNIGDVFRDISLVDCHVFGGGNTDAAAYATNDRCGFFVCGFPGADPDDQRDIRVINCTVQDFGLTAPVTVPFSIGIETRDITRPSVLGCFVRNVRDLGLHSFRTDGAVYEGCLSVGNDIGIWMHACTNYTEIGNTCTGNATADRDYHAGGSGPSTFLQAGGLYEVLARGSVTFPAGAPTLAGGAWNVTVDADVGTGHTRFLFTNPANASSRYSVMVTLSGSSAATCTYRSSSHTATTFNVETFTAGVAADEPYDFVVIGMSASTIEP